jgi:hypothetical protein
MGSGLSYIPWRLKPRATLYEVPLRALHLSGNYLVGLVFRQTKKQHGGASFESDN